MRLSRIERSQAGQSIIECNNVETAPAWQSNGLIERKHGTVGTALGSTAHSGVIDQDASHDGRGHGKEVSPILPIRRVAIDQSKVSFVN